MFSGEAFFVSASTTFWVPKATPPSGFSIGVGGVTACSTNKVMVRELTRREALITAGWRSRLTRSAMGSWQSSSGANVTTAVVMPPGVSTGFVAEREAAMRDPRSWLQLKLSSMSRWIFSHNAHPPGAPRSIMIGLDNAGKTSILYKLRLGESIVTVPTIGFNVETVSYQGHELTVWDIAGRHCTELGGVVRMRHYIANTQGLILVVDATDSERVPLARTELQQLLSTPDLRDALLLVFANKQDLPGAMSASQLANELGLTMEASAPRARWHVQACSAQSGLGLYPGLAWFADPDHWQWRPWAPRPANSDGENGGSVSELELPWERKQSVPEHECANVPPHAGSGTLRDTLPVELIK